MSAPPNKINKSEDSADDIIDYLNRELSSKDKDNTDDIEFDSDDFCGDETD